LLPDIFFTLSFSDHPYVTGASSKYDQRPDLDYCPNEARVMRIDVAMKNNFGFGGTNGTLVFKRI